MSEETNTLELAIIEEKDKDSAIIWAKYREARVKGSVSLKREDWTRIKQRCKDIEVLIEKGQPAIDPDGLKELGGWLFEKLFPDPVRRLYDAAIGAGDDVQSRLRLELVLAAPALAGIPWEMLYDKSHDRFLTTTRGTFMVRRPLMMSIRESPLETPPTPLKVLILAACPVTQEQLDTAEEARLIKSAFKDLVENNLAEIDVVPKAMPLDLHRRLLKDKYHVLHFIGHGSYDLGKEEGYLLFEGPGGRERRLSMSQLKMALNGKGLRLAVLNACKSAKVSTSDFNAGIGPALVVQGVPAVVAMQYGIPDNTAQLFAKLLYESLAMGLPLDEAVQEARIGVVLDIGDEGPDWGIPVLLTCAPSAPMFLAPAVPAPARRRSRVVPKLRPMQVGLWDFDANVGALDEAVQKLNGAQNYVEFQTLQLANPSGSVRITRRETAYLDAAKLFRQLGDAPERFNVDRIIVLTRHLIVDDDMSNLFATSNKAETLSVVSTANLREYARKAKRTFTRAVFYLILGEVISMANPEMDYHDETRGCLMDFCKNRDDLVLGLKAAKIDEDCAKKVKDKKLLAAVEKMLKTNV